MYIVHTESLIRGFTYSSGERNVNFIIMHNFKLLNLNMVPMLYVKVTFIIFHVKRYIYSIHKLYCDEIVLTNILSIPIKIFK